MSVCFKSVTYERNHNIILELDDSFHPNNVESTFGFHTAETVPVRNRNAYTTKHTVCGYEPEGILSEKECIRVVESAKKRCIKSYKSRSDAIALNSMNILGYIPGLGLVPCSVRLIYPLCNKDAAMHYESQEVKIAHYVRGAFEGAGLGSLYLIPDLAVTVKRFSYDKHPSDEFNRSKINQC